MLTDDRSVADKAEEFCQTFTSWKDKEVGRLTDEIAYVRAVHRARGGVEGTADDGRRGYEDMLAGLLGVP